ncbi:TPA: MFS transporter [Streptococcus suis]|nr:MFS transporter [Streptococcus suis]HEM6266176.1 MFS transporter [Streptococcus suis]HEM6289249.1 MFS transporter [Streptococcus suis]HEM6371336.1 MFS transporter [Streptococcus suis]
MVAVPIWRSFLLLLSFSSFFLVFYEDSQYKPFGFRYWLGLAACIWLNFVTLAFYFIAFTGGSIMVYNQYKMPLVVIFLICLFLASMLTFLSFKAIKIVIRRTKYYRQVRKEG